MHILWKLLFFVFYSAVGVYACPSGFVNETDGNCYSEDWSVQPQFLAYKECALNNGVMFDIHNAFENNFAKSMATGKDIIWLGLTCLTNDISSCLWDSGRQLKNGDYINFFGGSPNADTGACVYMKVSSGQWFSSDCTQTTASSRCLYTNVSVATCPDDAIYFRGKCHFSMLQWEYARAELSCSLDCGHLASIHSAGENSFVRDVARLVQANSSTFVGLQPLPNGGFNWTDASPYDYNNFGGSTVPPTSCVVLDQLDSGAKSGQWSGSSCENTVASVAVCRKDLSTKCDSKAAKTVLPPAQCTNTYHTSGAGTIFSPAYPSDSLANNCEYVITTLHSPSIIFTDLSLDGNSHIYLYSDMNNNSEFAHITNNSTFPLTFNSNSNIIRVIYTTSGGTHNYFRAEYGDGTYGAPILQRTDFYYNGTITSFGYPNEETMNTGWFYVLHSDKDRIEINFIDAYPYGDNIYVYDFNGQALTFFYRLSGNMTVSSYTDTVWIEFMTKEPAGYRGFKAEFWSVY